MKIVEAYTPVDIRACGAMLNGVLAAGGTIDQFREFAATLTAQAAHPEVRRYRLRFEIDDENFENNEDILRALGLGTLRSFNKLIRLFERRGIDLKQIKRSVKKLRKVELEGTNFGRLKE